MVPRSCSLGINQLVASATKHWKGQRAVGVKHHKQVRTKKEFEIKQQKGPWLKEPERPLNENARKSSGINLYHSYSYSYSDLDHLWMICI